MFKSKYRGQLEDNKLRIPVVMGTEEPFAEVAFEALFSSLCEFELGNQLSVTQKALRGVRS